MKEPEIIREKKRKVKIKRSSLQSIFSCDNSRTPAETIGAGALEDSLGQLELCSSDSIPLNAVKAGDKSIAPSKDRLGELDLQVLCSPEDTDVKTTLPVDTYSSQDGLLARSHRSVAGVRNEQGGTVGSGLLSQSPCQSSSSDVAQDQITSGGSTNQQDKRPVDQMNLKNLVQQKIVLPEKMTATKGVPDFLDFDRVWTLGEAIFSEPREGRKFSLACTIYSISDINDVMQTFRAKYRLMCNIGITREDVQRHMAIGCDRVHWAPDFVPFVRPFNAIEEIRKDVVEGTQGQQYSVQVLQKYWAAHFELDCETVFQVPFNVRRCPYDVQELKMTFQVENTRQDFNLPRYWGEWFWEPPYTAARWAITNMPQGDYMLDRKWIYLKRIPKPGHREMDQFQIVVLARRNWRFFFWRVMFVLFVINAVTGTCFLFDEFDDMMSFVATMLVANVAFSLSIADMIPHVAYLTYLDFYVYGSYIFMVSVVAEICFERAMSHYGHFSIQFASDFRWAMWLINSAGLLFGNLIWILISWRAYSLEQQRFESLLQEDVVHQKKMSWSKAQATEKSPFLSKKE